MRASAVVSQGKCAKYLMSSTIKGSVGFIGFVGIVLAPNCKVVVKHGLRPAMGCAGVVLTSPSA